MWRILNIEVNVEFFSELMNNWRLMVWDRMKIIEGFVGVGVFDFVRIGESDVEVIEEEEEFLGVIFVVFGKWCFVCGCFFFVSYD